MIDSICTGSQQATSNKMSTIWITTLIVSVAVVIDAIVDYIVCTISVNIMCVRVSAAICCCEHYSTDFLAFLPWNGVLQLFAADCVPTV